MEYCQLHMTSKTKYSMSECRPSQGHGFIVRLKTKDFRWNVFTFGHALEFT